MWNISRFMSPLLFSIAIRFDQIKALSDIVFTFKCSIAGGVQPQTKKWQMELLMERIRSKSTQHKTFQEISRNLRISMLGKQYALDSVEKSNLQKCLDQMQHCIKVITPSILGPIFSP